MNGDSFGGFFTLSPTWGPIGEITYLRTYARPLGRRREYWHETVDRVVKYSAELGPLYPGEADDLKHHLAHHRIFVAGRTLWIGGTDLARANGVANYNCAFVVLDHPKAFYDLVLLLMSGAGVGGRMLPDDVQGLQQVIPIGREPPRLEIDPYNWVGYNSSTYHEHTATYRRPDGAYVIYVGDSREGWAEAIMEYLFALSRERYIVINVDSVRPHGERLKRFGGYASGPEPLIDMFRMARVAAFAKSRPVGWTDLKVLDIFNLIGRTIVSGGARRSAESALGASRDFANAKRGKWADDKSFAEWEAAIDIPPDVIPSWRSQSNNSLVYESHPGRDGIYEVVRAALEYGEPGFFNLAAARLRRADAEGSNPCFEILLRNHGVCNLVTVNLASYTSKGNGIDIEAASKAFKLATRHAMRITTVGFDESLAEWQQVQSEDRLIGVSMTGIMDAVYRSGLPTSVVMRMTRHFKEVVRREAREYAAQMGVPEPVLTTTIKPEGTQSLMPGVSAGIHDPYAPYYIRRIRFSTSDPLAEALIRQGFAYEHDVYVPNTLVFSFPVASSATRSANDVPAVEMLERYRMSMRYYTEHNTSITVAVGEDEVEDVVNWLDRHWHDVVAVSLLPKQTTVYPQQPYEEISQDEYERLVAKTPKFNRSVLDEIEGASGAIVSEVDADCATGVCPVR